MGYTTWTGTVSAYKLLHRRINQRFGRPKVCEDCGSKTAKKYEWANISGKYLEDRTDWRRLCCKCHKRLDASSFVGKRFSGKKHTLESRRKTAESMKRYWAENREKMMAIQPRGVKSARYKHGKYMKGGLAW